MLEARIQSHDEDLVIEGLGVLQDMSLLEQPLVNDYIEHIVQFCVTIIRTAELEPSLKRSAGQTLMDIVEHRPKVRQITHTDFDLTTPDCWVHHSCSPRKVL